MIYRDVFETRTILVTQSHFCGDLRQDSFHSFCKLIIKNKMGSYILNSKLYSTLGLVHCSSGHNSIYIGKVFPRCNMSICPINQKLITSKMYQTVIIHDGFSTFITASRRPTMTDQVTTPSTSVAQNSTSTLTEISLYSFLVSQPAFEKLPYLYTKTQDGKLVSLKMHYEIPIT